MLKGRNLRDGMEGTSGRPVLCRQVGRVSSGTSCCAGQAWTAGKPCNSEHTHLGGGGGRAAMIGGGRLPRGPGGGGGEETRLLMGRGGGGGPV